MIQLANDHWLQPAEAEWSQIHLDQPNVHRVLALEIRLEAEAAARLHDALRLVHEEQVKDPLYARRIGTRIGGIVVGESGDQWPPPEQPSPAWRVGLTEVDFFQAIHEVEALLRCSPSSSGSPTSRCS